MKKLLLLLICLFSAAALRAQEVNWAVNTPTPSFVKDLVVDASSNLYLYGHLQTYHPSNLEGSTIRKYSPSGRHLFAKTWSGPVFLSSMINDGKGHFYFCGHYRGSIQDNGLSLHSQGESDGFFGKMDEEGNVEWAISFGGAKTDKATDLTFNSDSTELVLTGGVDSTILMYGYEISTPPKSIFVARLNLDGGMAAYKTYAFTTNEYGTNMGLEIAPNAAGGYYLLADRMGDHWSNEAHPSGSAMEGRYVYNLDGNLNILWSRFIISSSCYYGYDCANMGIQGGMACVPSFCSGKYGGSGHLQKLDAASGLTTLSIDNTDGRYDDTYAAGNALFYVGNEEANGCPCEDNNPGFARVKVLDENNADRVLLSKYGFHFYQIVQAPNGNICVFGHTDYRGDYQIQGHQVSEGYFLFSMKNPDPSYKAPEPASDILTAFPNPSSGYVEVVDKELMQELIVLNSSGVIVKQVQPNAKSYTFRDLSPGYYIVRAKNSEGYRSGKILVNP